MTPFARTQLSSYAGDFAKLEARLDRLERKIDLILGHLGIQSAQPSKLVMKLLESGQIVQAIKAYKEEVGVTMSEAEIRIDALREEKPRRRGAKRSS